MLWAGISTIWCCAASRQLSATFDEPLYVARGLEVWRTGSHRGLMQLGTMPLPVDVATLPLYLWERAHDLRFDVETDLDQLLPWARAGTLLFWWVLLFYARLAGRQLAGPWGGRLAVAFLACEPSLLAHATLATTDLAVTACLVALVYHFRTGRAGPWPRRVGWPLLWFGAAVLAKASGLAFGVLCLFAVEIEYLLSRARSSDGTSGQAAGTTPSLGRSLGRLYSAFQPFRRDARQIVFGGLVLVFLYCGSDWQPQESLVRWAHDLPDGLSARALAWTVDHVRIFSNAGEGIVRQVRHNVRGHGTYLLGQVADRSIWYYFPVALSIKLSLPVLLLPLVAGVTRPGSLRNWALLSALVLFVFSFNCRVQIGIRLILPLVAFTIIGVTAALVSAMSRAGPAPGWQAPWRQRLLGPLTALALGWAAVAAVRVWPNALCYTNEFWGGTERGYLLLSDSNYDWGQGLKELARWQKRHPEAPLDVWYFGSDPVLKRLPMHQLRLHTLRLEGPEAVRACLQGHYFAVSTTLLHGSMSTIMRSGPPHELTSYCQTLAFLNSCRPVDRTSTFLIYDFTGRGRSSLAADTSRGYTQGKRGEERKK